MATSTCPDCGDELTGRALRDGRCQSCGAVLPDDEPERQHDEHVTGDEPPPRAAEPAGPLEGRWRDIEIRRGRHGETLAVLALLLPVAAQVVLLAGRLHSLGAEIALGWGSVGVTALLLTIDAAFLGTTDLRGRTRASPGLLFLGMILLWIVFYPAAFFRRRHFGRPNLGPLAILVALFFLAAPFLQQFLAFGVLGDGPPTCTSSEVVGMVDDIIRKGAGGASVRSASGHREVSYDPASQVRKGQCLVKTDTETITVTYSVKLLNRANGTFQVEVEPYFPADPPSCTDPEVKAVLERIIREGPRGQLLVSLAGHEEVRYDRDNKTRHGRCRVTMRDGAGDITYKVYWTDQKQGQYQVEIEP
jgi:hypothetical protein